MSRGPNTPDAQAELAAMASTVEQMRQLSPWRIIRLYQLMGEVQGGVRRLMTHLREQGSLWLDLQLFLPGLLLVLFKAQYFLAAVGLLFGAIAALLTVTGQESVIEHVTQNVTRTRTDSFWFFWTRTVQYTEQVTVPVSVDRAAPVAPADVLVWALVVLVLVALCYGVCWLLKRVWQAARNHRWLNNLVGRYSPGGPR